MISVSCDLKSRSGLRTQGLIRLLIGAGCIRVVLTLAAGSGPSGVSIAASTVHWILCAGSLVLLALLDWDAQRHYPGIGSLFRGGSYAALAGSLLPCAASLHCFADLGPTPALAGALAGLALTLSSAMLLEWLGGDVRIDGPLPCEGAVMARLGALVEIVDRSRGLKAR